MRDCAGEVAAKDDIALALPQRSGRARIRL
jgi:hypothetical protein